MFDLRKVLQSYSARVSRFGTVHSPCFGGAYNNNLRLTLTTDSAAKFFIILAICAIIYCGLSTLHDFESLLEDMTSSPAGFIYLLLMRMFITVNIIVFVWRVLLVLGYRPAPTATDRQLPYCTVIMPAYNEGKTVLKTLRSILKSDYPAKKLQIIAVNDGSKDDTLQWMQSAIAQSNGRIELINFTANRGKRAAIYEAVRKSRGEIFVTIDSDSIIEHKTIRRLVSPFVYDQKIGAVAGNVRVLNRRQGLIPRMLEVSFAYSFDFIRASQSMVNTVFCTPGALSAYKKKTIMKDMKAWLNQTFMGKPATIGEDRAITNLVLKNGYHVRFQSNAMVYTIVPTTYKQLCKMFLRWARSNVRETFVMGDFIFKKFRKGSTSGAIINFIMTTINMIIPQTLIGAIVSAIVCRPEIYFSQVVFGACLTATVPAIFYIIRRRSSESLWAYAYSLFWLIGLWWITIWAIITMGNGKWLTRDLPVGQRPEWTTRLVQWLKAA